MTKARRPEPWPADAVERRPVADLTAYARNARTHSDAQVDQLVASIRKWGWTVPVLIDEAGQIIAGHGRVMAATRMGLADVPVMVARGWSDAKKRAYVLADNKLAENAGWDEALVAAELADLQAMGEDLQIIGFSDRELRLALGGAVEGATDADAVPAAPRRPVTALGDVWDIPGGHRLVCGDATSAEAWASLQIGGRRTLVFTSPPYGVGTTARIRDHYVRGRRSRKSLYENHADDVGPWPQLMRDWTTLALAECEAIVCNVQMLAQNKRAFIEWTMAFADHLIDVAIWDKGHGPPQMQANILTNAFEWLVLLSGAAGASRTIPMADFKGTIPNVLRVGPNSDNVFADVHRATMPVAVADWAVRLCPLAQLVVDPFGGTGTTAVAAHRLGKASALIELDPVYCDVILRRVTEFAGMGPARLGGSAGPTFDQVAAQRGVEVEDGATRSAA